MGCNSSRPEVQENTAPETTTVQTATHATKHEPANLQSASTRNAKKHEPSNPQSASSRNAIQAFVADDDEDDEDRDSYTSEGKSAPKNFFAKVPDQPQAKKKGLPAFKAFGAEDERSRQPIVAGKKALPALDAPRGSLFSDPEDAPFKPNRAIQAKPKPNRSAQPSHGDEVLTLVDDFIDEELRQNEEVRRPLKDTKHPPPPKPISREESTESAESLESAFCLDSPPRTPMRAPKFNKPKHTEKPAMRPGGDPFAPHKNETFNLLGDGYDDDVYGYNGDKHNEQSKEREYDDEYGPPKRRDPWDDITARYAISRKPITPAKHSRPHTALVAEEDDEWEAVRRGNKKNDNRAVDTWDGVQPVSNVARDQWKHLEEVEDFDVDYELENMTAPVLKHMDSGSSVHKPRKSRRQKNAAVSDEEEEILDLDQIVDEIDKMGSGDEGARGLHFDFRRRGEARAARAESHAADLVQHRRSANKERFVDEVDGDVGSDDDDVNNMVNEFGNSSDDDVYDGYGNGPRKHSSNTSRKRPSSKAHRHAKSPKPKAPSPKPQPMQSRSRSRTKAPEVDMRGLDEDSADQVHKFSY